uniref:Uncharacterized protein n=1 Tax=Entomoneis paludosa TaxID=265537 RepID=A0A6U2WPC8_9STRA
MSKLLATLTVAILPLCQASESYPAIWDYRPKNDVAFMSAIAADLRDMDLLMQDEEGDGFLMARSIYEHGGNSLPHATLSIKSGLPFNVEEGSILQGTGINGKPTTVKVERSSFAKGDTHLRVIFESQNPVCRRPGIPNSDTGGCLEETGTLSLEGKPETISYSYSTANDIKSDHTIRNFSINAKSKFKAHGSTHGAFFKDFQKYVDYFGVPDFGDKIISAAFDKSSVSFDDRSLVLEFGNFSPRARRSLIIHTSAYLVVGLFVLRELETALTKCDHRCGPANCNHDSIHALDGAVALYTGAVFQETGKGNLLFGLAENMCKEFRTCGSHASHTSGHAKVNIDIFKEFNDMQKNFDASHCLEAKINKETIAHELFVPLFQAALLSLHLDQEEDTWESRAERVVFMTTVLPVLHRCDTEITQDIASRIDPTKVAEHDTFSVVKEHFESNYRCMGLGCLDMGGLWDSKEGDYLKGADSCYVPPEAEESAGLSTFHVLVMAVLAICAVGMVAYLMIKRRRRRAASRRRTRDVFDNDSDSDDDSVDSLNSLT